MKKLLLVLISISTACNVTHFGKLRVSFSDDSGAGSGIRAVALREKELKMQGPEEVTLPAQVFSNIKSSAMVMVELSRQIDDIVLPMVEGDERLQLLDTLIISLREHAMVLLEKIRLAESPTD
ncbi:MAG: hypothetical protein LPK02_14235 [Rhodobacterales bacterium]|nr:hypothetical protein [Rhodobacterales bacterium]